MCLILIKISVCGGVTYKAVRAIWTWYHPTHGAHQVPASYLELYLAPYLLQATTINNLFTTSYKTGSNVKWADGGDEAEL